MGAALHATTFQQAVDDLSPTSFTGHMALPSSLLLQGNLAGCVSKPLGEAVGEVLCRETLKADPAALAALMADHTRVSK